jgi:hypothetical protein
MLDERLTLLNHLAKELEAGGLEVSVDPETVCVGRDQWDRYSTQILSMLSAAPAITAGEKSFNIYASEQYDRDNRLVKYSIKLCDGAKRQLRAWELDTKRGQHQHVYENNVKDPDHRPHEGSIPDIANEMMSVMRMAEPEP